MPDHQTYKEPHHSTNHFDAGSIIYSFNSESKSSFSNAVSAKGGLRLFNS